MPVALLEAVDRRDVRMIQRASDFASRWKRARRSASPANDAGSTLIATSRFSFVSRRAIDLAHSARADGRGDLVDAEASAGSEAQVAGSIALGRADVITPATRRSGNLAEAAGDGLEAVADAQVLTHARQRKTPKRVLALPDLEQSKTAVLNTLDLGKR